MLEKLALTQHPETLNTSQKSQEGNQSPWVLDYTSDIPFAAPISQQTWMQHEITVVKHLVAVLPPHLVPRATSTNQMHTVCIAAVDCVTLHADCDDPA